MRIVHVLTRLLRAGSEENTIATCLWQADHGHEVTLIHGPDPDPHWADLHKDKIRFVTLPDLVHPISPLNDFRAFRALRSAYRDLEPDVIHTHQSKAGILGRLAATAVPSALVVHGIHIIPFDGVSAAKRLIYIAAEKAAARRTDIFLAVSRSVGQAYIDANICSHVEPVYSGMPLEPFQTAKPPEDWPSLLGMPDAADDKPKAVLMLAAFEPRKRHSEFLQAIAKVAKKLPETRFLFAGKGPIEDDVRKAVASLDLSDMITFCGFRPDPQALIAMADLCILTSEREGLPRVVVQYIAAGKPVIVADLPGIDEIVQDGVNGLISDPGDMDDTVAKMKMLLMEPQHLSKLAAGARATDVSGWELERLGSRTTELYLSASENLPLSRRPVRPAQRAKT